MSVTKATTRAACAGLGAAALLAGAVWGRLPARAQGTAPDSGAACAADLKQIGIVLQMYTQDYDGVLPPMNTPARAQAALKPYVQSADIFRCPVTRRPFVFNAALGGRALAKVAKPGTAFLVRDPSPHPDGVRETLYADGHIGKIAAKRGAGKSR